MSDYIITYSPNQFEINISRELNVNELAAVHAATAPSAANPFVTPTSTVDWTGPQTINLSGAAFTKHESAGYEAALKIKGRSVQTLDGRAIEIYLNENIASPEWDVGTYFTSSGAMFTSAGIICSGHPRLLGAPEYHVVIDLPDLTIPAMLYVWGDVAGPCISLRPPDTTSNGTDSIGYQLLCWSGKDKYAVFSIEEYGMLQWGMTTKAGMDTNLYRKSANILKTDDAFEVALNVGIGGVPASGVGLTITDAATPYFRLVRGSTDVFDIYHDGSNCNVFNKVGSVNIATTQTASSIEINTKSWIYIKTYGVARQFLQCYDDGAAAYIGFFNGGPQGKTTITGSRGGNAALASLLTALAGFGLITDSTS